MRTGLITFAVSTIASIALWQFGLSGLIWPAHPFLAAVGIATCCGIAAQLILPRNSATPKL